MMMLNAFKSKKYKDIYFCRIEEYGQGDIDAMKCLILITRKIDEKVKELIKKYYLNKTLKLLI